MWWTSGWNKKKKRKEECLFAAVAHVVCQNYPERSLWVWPSNQAPFDMEDTEFDEYTHSDYCSSRWLCWLSKSEGLSQRRYGSCCEQQVPFQRCCCGVAGPTTLEFFPIQVYTRREVKKLFLAVTMLLVGIGNLTCSSWSTTCGGYCWHDTNNWCYWCLWCPGTILCIRSPPCSRRPCS